MATSFQDMRDAVIAQTKRPELVAVTDNAIKMATLRAHQVDFFSRDQANYLFTYTPPIGNQLFVDIEDIYTAVPRLRTPDFVQGEDLTTFVPSETLQYVPDFKDFWDADKTLQYCVFTLMGNTLRIRFLAPSGRARLFYYTNPDVSVATYSSWIADLYKEELAMWAAGIVWARSGFQEIAQQNASSVLDFKDRLVASHLSSKV